VTQRSDRQNHLSVLTVTKIWCQRRDSNSQTPVSKTGRYSNSRTLALVHRGGFEPPRPTRGDRVTAGPFRPGSRTCANLAEGRRIERPSLITMPRFSGPVAASLDRKRLGADFCAEGGSRSEAFSIRRLGGSRWRLRRTRGAMGFESTLGWKLLYR
jgi:hypothetical protein